MASKTIDHLFLNFSGLVFQISLHPSNSTDSKPYWRRILRRFFGNLYVENPKRIDVRIDFIDPPVADYAIYTIDDKISTFIGRVNKTNKIDFYYSTKLFHFQLIVKHLLAKLIRDGFMLHASAVAEKDGAILFLGESGFGKSTAVKLLKKHYRVIGDDSVVVRHEANGFFVYQTPFLEKAKWIKRKQTRFILRKVFFLKKSDHFAIKKITDKKEILHLLINLVDMTKTNQRERMKLLSDFLQKYREFYYLYFRKDSKLEKYKLFK